MNEKQLRSQIRSLERIQDVIDEERDRLQNEHDELTGNSVEEQVKDLRWNTFIENLIFEEEVAIAGIMSGAQSVTCDGKKVAIEFDSSWHIFSGAIENSRKMWERILKVQFGDVKVTITYLPRDNS